MRDLISEMQRLVFCTMTQFAKGAFRPELKPFVGRLAENDGLREAPNDS